jgi:NitT/TauT family transport system permease protein
MVSDSWLARSLPPAALFFGLLALWVIAVRIFPIPSYILPSPSLVAAAAFGSEIAWGLHIWVTTLEIIGGFLLAGVAGVLLGVMIAWSTIAERTLVPFLVFVNTLPKVAVAPLFLLWLGYGVFPNIVIAALIGFFPVVINTAVGLSQSPEEMLDLGRIFGASKARIFRKIRIPGALPYILSALKVSATTAVIGAIVGEFVASQRGLGYVIINAQMTLNTPVAFVALIWISIIGLIAYGSVSLAGRWLAPWAEGLSGDGRSA